MSCFDKNQYKLLKQCAKQDNLKVFAVEYESSTYNGIAVAFSIPRDGLRMIDVAVSYCSPEDCFKPKHGKYQALNKMYMGFETIKLPLGHLTVDEIEDALINTFLIP